MSTPRGDDELILVLVLRRLAFVCVAALAGTASLKARWRRRHGPGGQRRRHARRPERHHGERQHRGADRDGRGEQEEHLVDVAGDDVFLEQELEPVGDRLQQPARPDAVGADAVLHVRAQILRSTQIR